MRDNREAREQQDSEAEGERNGRDDERSRFLGNRLMHGAHVIGRSTAELVVSSEQMNRSVDRDTDRDDGDYGGARVKRNVEEPHDPEHDRNGDHGGNHRDCAALQRREHRGHDHEDQRQQEAEALELSDHQRLGRAVHHQIFPDDARLELRSGNFSEHLLQLGDVPVEQVRIVDRVTNNNVRASKIG